MADSIFGAALGGCDEALDGGFALLDIALPSSAL